MWASGACGRKPTACCRSRVARQVASNVQHRPARRPRDRCVPRLTHMCTHGCGHTFQRCALLFATRTVGACVAQEASVRLLYCAARACASFTAHSNHMWGVLQDQKLHSNLLFCARPIPYQHPQEHIHHLTRHAHTLTNALPPRHVPSSPIDRHNVDQDRHRHRSSSTLSEILRRLVLTVSTLL